MITLNNPNPLNIKSTYSENFRHRITYTAYLSDDINVLKFAKNCGNYKINHAFKDYHLKTFTKVVEFDKIEEKPTKVNKITIKMEELEHSTKYHGIVVAKIELIPIEEGYISPVRSGKTYYDEFVFMTPKYEMPFIYMISLMALLAFFFVLFCIIKACVFGRVNSLKGMVKLSDMAGFDDGILGHNIMSMLENEYFDDVSPVNLDDRDHASDGDTRDESHVEEKEGEIELTDNSDASRPLDE